MEKMLNTYAILSFGENSFYLKEGERTLKEIFIDA